MIEWEWERGIKRVLNRETKRGTERDWQERQQRDREDNDEETETKNENRR